jgi:hypothetical protein
MTKQRNERLDPSRQEMANTPLVTAKAQVVIQVDLYPSFIPTKTESGTEATTVRITLIPRKTPIRSSSRESSKELSETKVGRVEIIATIEIAMKGNQKSNSLVNLITSKRLAESPLPAAFAMVHFND